MIVVERAKALALKLNNPSPVLEAVASAKMLRIGDHKIVVCPHRLEEVQTLRNIGFDAPSPILHYYDWPGRFKPFDHQKQTASFLTVNHRGIVLNEIGTGKTQAALWAADYLIKTGAAKKVLIMSPLSTLERVWGDAVFMNFPHRKHVVLHGDAKRRKKRLSFDVDFYIVNHDGFPIIANECHGMFDAVIIDEAAVYRNAKTSRYKVLKRWLEKNEATRLWMLTGTPTPNEPADAWALAQLLKSPFCTETYTAFKDQVMFKVSMYKWEARPHAMQIVQHVLQPSIRYTRDECFDLPDTMLQTREVELSPEQSRHYATMLKHFISEVTENKSTITAVSEAAKAMKLVQIACGVAYGDNGENVELPCAPRINAVKEIIEEAGQKVIVFVPLTGTLRMLERELSKHWSVGVVNGEVSTTQRNEIFHNFQNTRDPHVLIAHPATMAHGLTLTAASTVVWYGPINSNEQYVQANGRIERIGKKHVSNVIHIQASQLERLMFKRLQKKQHLQGVLLELIAQQTREADEERTDTGSD